MTGAELDQEAVVKAVQRWNEYVAACTSVGVDGQLVLDVAFQATKAALESGERGTVVFDNQPVLDAAKSVAETPEEADAALSKIAAAWDSYVSASAEIGISMKTTQP